jgi:G:T-mismatch repair DNA endonuclease (very short patch repair protein)
VYKCVYKLSKNFEQILLRAPINFEEQNKVLEPSIIITKYCIIIITNYCFIITNNCFIIITNYYFIIITN